jgi:UDP-N-acetylmuramyl pentapeptide synthase
LPVKANKFSEVYLIGPYMKNLYEELQKRSVNVKHFSGRKRLNDFLKTRDLSNSVILVKGSRGMKMEEFVRTIEENAG